MKFTIIIPTRERCDTLPYTIRTCLLQDYEPLEIIVSDNFSQDKTREVVHSFTDRRIKYINTQERLSLAKNLEFAFSFIDKGFVTYIGDDDGMLLNAVKDTASIIDKTKTPALAWMKAEYGWPSHPRKEQRNKLSIPLSKSLFLYQKNKILRDTANFWICYNRCPLLYNSFVDFEIIKKVKDKTGSFFYSLSADIYSGFATLSVIEKYLFSLRPFTVNGASAHSLGTAGCVCGRNSGPVKTSLGEIDIVAHEKIEAIQESVVSSVAEALFQANRHCFNDSIKINMKKIIRKIFIELSQRESEVYNFAVKDLMELAGKNGLKKFARMCERRYPRKPARTGSGELGLDNRGILTLDAQKFGVDNVYDASLLVSRILGDYCLSDKILGYSFFDKIYSRLFRLIFNSVRDKTL